MATQLQQPERQGIIRRIPARKQASISEGPILPERDAEPVPLKPDDEKRPYQRSSVINIIKSRESLAERGDAPTEFVAQVNQVKQGYMEQVGGVEQYIIDLTGKDEHRQRLVDRPPELCLAVFADGQTKLGSSEGGKYGTILAWLLSLDELPKKICIARPNSDPLCRYLS
jgi:hypothetical protein